MYDRGNATALTLDELHRALEAAAIANNVTVEIVTSDGTKLMSATNVIEVDMHYKDEDDEDGERVERSHGDKSAQQYNLLGSVTVFEDGSLGHAESESWFMIPDYYAIDHIDRVDGSSEQTIAIDCEYVYYVVLKDGITIRIEI